MSFFLMLEEVFLDCFINNFNISADKTVYRCYFSKRRKFMFDDDDVDHGNDEY
jgi:hypothetical protein